MTAASLPRRTSRLRYVVLCLPLIVASMAFALISPVDARAFPYDDSTLAARGDAVSVPSPNNFVVGSIIGQPPTTRHYNFVVSQRQGAPDGFSKPMLVVNGMYPGPTIEANQHDRIVVKVTNMLENRTTIHWHGLVSSICCLSVSLLICVWL